jgi:hypothetical protein
MAKEKFIVAAISLNHGSFGHKNHILVSESGKAFDCLRQPEAHSPGTRDLSVGDVLEFEVDKAGAPTMWFTERFEVIFPSIHGNPSQEVYDQIWAKQKPPQ